MKQELTILFGEKIEKNINFNQYMSSPPKPLSSISDLVAQNLLNVIKRDQDRSIPLFLEVKESFIQKLALKIINSSVKPFVIGIAGASASGKTTLAENILRVCTTRQSLYNNEQLFTLLKYDDYYKDWSIQLKEAGSYEEFFARGYSFDTPDALNFDLIKRHMKELIKGTPVISPNYNYVTCESTPAGELKQPASLLFTEGLFALNSKVKDFLDIAIYVHTPSNVVKERWYKRAIQRGKSEKEAEKQFEIVNSEAQRHIKPTLKAADVVVSGLASSEYIEFITDEIYTALSNLLVCV